MSEREFDPVENPKDAKLLLQEGAKTLAAAMIWIKDQEAVIQTNMSAFDDDESILYCWIPKNFEPTKFMDELAKAKATHCFFSVSLARANIFFKAEYKGHDKTGLRFKMPEKIFKVQRRKAMRLPIMYDQYIGVDFTDPLFSERKMTKKIVDLSAGGLAFLGTVDDKSVFLPGLILRNLTFTINKRTIRVDAEVRHAQPTKDSVKGNATKVGILFQNIRPTDADHIAAYVFEESRKYFSRLL